MRILIATDSFKDALSAIDVCRAIERGLRRARPDVETVLFPLADGGEGMDEILTYHTGGQLVTARVHDPLFRLIEARYGLSADGSTAFIAMASASGLPLLRPEERDPRRTTTLGAGELIGDAIRRGVRRIILGIGGSATNDGGVGMATALGYTFPDKGGQPVSPTGGNLTSIAQIDDDGRQFDPEKYQFEVWCDVDNPLYGPKGAARVYAPQKGASPEAVEELDAGLHHLAVLLEEKFGKPFDHIPGAGAAGGLGAGAMAFLGAKLRPGIDAIMDMASFNEKLRGADLIVTGEGKIDAQTLSGKLIQGVTGRAKTRKIPVIALCGALDLTPDQTEALGLRAAFSILRQPIALSAALGRTAEDLEQTAYHLLRTWRRY